MSVSGVVINKGKIGANTIGILSSVSGLIVAGAAPEGIVAGTVVPLTSTDDAIALGITADFDSVNNVRLHRHVSEFFRMSGEGTQLHLMCVGADVEMSAILSTATIAQKLLKEANGAIYQLGVAVTPAVVDEVVDGLSSEVIGALPKAQELADWAYQNFMPIHVILEGRSFSANASTCANLRKYEVAEDVILVAPNVSVCVGQDWNYADTQNAVGKNFADVGNYLGSIALIAVNENPGAVDKMNITNTARGIFLTAGFSNHTKVSASTTLQAIDNKGYIFAMNYAGVSGCRWNDDHSCVEIIIDQEGNMNEHTIAYSRTMSHSSRELRRALLPYVKNVIPVDAKTGKLPAGVVKNFDSVGNNVMSNLIGQRLISGGISVTDPSSDVLVQKVLDISFIIVPYGTIGQITGTLNLKRQV